MHRAEERRHAEIEAHRHDEEEHHRKLEENESSKKKQDSPKKKQYSDDSSHDRYMYHDIETQKHADRDHYRTLGYEDEEEGFGHELPCHHTFDEEDPLYKEHEHGFERE